MTHLIPSRRLRFRGAPIVALCGYSPLGAVLLTGQAPQARSISEGVYSTGQASRVQQLYKAQCAGCHGSALEGTSGPPLAGDGALR